MSLARAALLAVLCLAPLTPAHAQEPTEEQVTAALKFSMNYATSIVYHEVGHMLVGELGLPVLGKEEDAADSLAAILMLNDDSDPESWDALIDSADGWYFSATHSTGATIEDFSYYDEHSLDIQRAYAMVCMMVGKEPDYFSEVAKSYELSQDRVDGCSYTYMQAANAWDTLLAPHVVDGEQGVPIKVVYDDGGDYQFFADAVRKDKLLEKAAALVMSKYVIPREVTFRGALCGEANAYYSVSEAQVTFCYEMAEDTYNLFINDIAPLYEEGELSGGAEADESEGVKATFSANDWPWVLE